MGMKNGDEKWGRIGAGERKKRKTKEKQKKNKGETKGTREKPNKKPNKNQIKAIKKYKRHT